jgi:3-isopropylmalate dehydrogenase
MSLMQDPRRYDVVVTENLFGDILTDLASVISGSLGVLPSASLRPTGGRNRFGMYEPVHGSAPTLTGQNAANPIGCILSGALMLEWSFDRADLAESIRRGVETLLERHYVTADLAVSPEQGVTTTAFAAELIATLPAAARHSVSTGVQ